MSRQTHLHMLKSYISAVNTALLTKRLSAEHLARLRAQGAELLFQAERAYSRQAKGPRAHVVKAAEQRAIEPFTITWRSTGKRQHVQGWQALCNVTGLSMASLRTLLSAGRGSFARVMINDQGAEDTTTIVRVNYKPRTKQDSCQ